MKAFNDSRKSRNFFSLNGFKFKISSGFPRHMTRSRSLPQGSSGLAATVNPLESDGWMAFFDDTLKPGLPKGRLQIHAD
ncbi:uncharacterized protein TRIREDRAFT_111736 [Trichoderma reesei QM6a]|jgi:hypothetical protein|uniref:Predicted protein n=2 Tax=Hypocrea jecorina TaxID=51453 RepID=G0RVA7_HYPJQ|nr:uncharacterized protein TRIREDRAFT_111736 [Trichoderma reesei QM6a]EGR44777.1 predicted protein [Trichoderma reesei QM6a]ETR97756.1 hypothetical protein M419DRAFT_134282 [Trichoderma reesei RUT C-30]